MAASNKEYKGQAAGSDRPAEPEMPDKKETFTGGERKKLREDKEFSSLMNRLKRIEGQVRGVERMLEQDAYCPDILVQVSSINSALNSFNKELLASHIRTCVADDIRKGNDETIDELVKLLQKLMR
jgi:DNA-binding FrmR family transcriptional regulator